MKETVAAPNVDTILALSDAIREATVKAWKETDATNGEVVSSLLTTLAYTVLVCQDKEPNERNLSDLGLKLKQAIDDTAYLHLVEAP